MYGEYVYYTVILGRHKRISVGCCCCTGTNYNPSPREKDAMTEMSQFNRNKDLHADYVVSQCEMWMEQEDIETGWYSSCNVMPGLFCLNSEKYSRIDYSFVNIIQGGGVVDMVLNFICTIKGCHDVIILIFLQRYSLCFSWFYRYKENWIIIDYNNVTVWHENDFYN